MKATVLLRHEIKSVDDYIDNNSKLTKNSFSNLQQTAIRGEIKKVNSMKSLPYVKMENL